jgi:hypothetical protein
MARSNESFNRRERERAKKQKADEKRQRRLNKTEALPADEESPDAAPSPEPVDQSVVLRKLAELNDAFDAGDLTFEDFDEQRTALLATLTID